MMPRLQKLSKLFSKLNFALPNIEEIRESVFVPSSFIDPETPSIDKVNEENE